jgi:hypothetical protein
LCLLVCGLEASGIGEALESRRLASSWEIAWLY